MYSPLIPRDKYSVPWIIIDKYNDRSKTTAKMEKLQDWIETRTQTTLSLSYCCFESWFLKTQKSSVFFSFCDFFIFGNYFNWRIITLQYGDVFCHTSTSIGHRYTCVPRNPEPPPYLPPHSILLCCPRAPTFGYPALCIELALVIYFTCGKYCIFIYTGVYMYTHIYRV